MPKFDTPVYLLSMLPDNPRTNIAIDRIIKQFGYEPTLVGGLNGARCNERLFWPSANEDLSLGQLACATGILTLICKFLESGRSHCLVCEDDVFFRESAEIFDTVHAIVHYHSHGEWDWIHCGSWWNVRRGIIPPVALAGDPEWSYSVRLPNPEKDVSEIKVARARECLYGTHCFFLSRRGAVKILSRSVPLTAPIDCYTRFSRSNDLVYQVMQDIGCPDPRMDSIIGSLKPLVS